MFTSTREINTDCLLLKIVVVVIVRLDLGVKSQVERWAWEERQQDVAAEIFVCCVGSKINIGLVASPHHTA